MCTASTHKLSRHYLKVRAQIYASADRHEEAHRDATWALEHCEAELHAHDDSSGRDSRRAPFSGIARVAQIPLFKLRGDSCFHRRDYTRALANYRAVCGLCQQEMEGGALGDEDKIHLQELLENTLVAAVHAKRARGLSKPLKQLSAPAKAEDWVRTSAIIGVYQSWSGHLVLWEALRSERLRELGAQAAKLAAAASY